MATYIELAQLMEQSDLIRKVGVAARVAAEAIRVNATATAAQKAWAREALENNATVARKLLGSVLIQNKNATVAQIESASDATIQTAVDAAVPLFAV